VWPLGIVALLLMNMTIVGITVYFAASDPSVGVEPDYYQKAVAWDKTARQREADRALGWQASADVGRGEAGRPALVVTLADREGRPISGAQVTAVAFPNTRSTQRQTLTLAPAGEGRYTAPLALTAGGLWQVRLEARTTADTFTSTCTLIAP
jgi:nitrogen fixation protein FixH